MQTDLGVLAARCMELAVAQRAGITYSLHDLTAEEFSGLPIALHELEQWRQEANQEES